MALPEAPIVPGVTVGHDDAHEALNRVFNKSNWLLDSDNAATVKSKILNPDGPLLLLEPGGNFPVGDEILVPPHVSLVALAKATFGITAAGGRLSFEGRDEGTVCSGFTIHGGNVASLPFFAGSIPVYTPPWTYDSGSKGVFDNIIIRNTGTGGTVAKLSHLQNFEFRSFKTVGNDLATKGVHVTDGSKNIDFYSPRFSSVNGPNEVIDTEVGDDRTSKINHYGGGMENGDGVVIGDCEQVYYHAVPFNAMSGDTSRAFWFKAQGNRDREPAGGDPGVGDGPFQGANFGIYDCQFQGWQCALEIDAAVLGIDVGGNFTGGLSTAAYKVNHASARIREVRPHGSVAATRFVGTNGAVEGTCVWQPVAWPT